MDHLVGKLKRMKSVALLEMMKDTIYLRGGLRHMRYKNCIDECIVIYCDKVLHIQVEMQ